jgi:hypothetical protein
MQDVTEFLDGVPSQGMEQGANVQFSGADCFIYQEFSYALVGANFIEVSKAKTCIPISSARIR